MDTAPPLTGSEVIDRVRAARQAEQAAAFAQLDLAVSWALLHPCPANAYPAHWGEPNLPEETVAPLAGQGAPWVAEFAPADLGAALGISLNAAKLLIGDALEPPTGCLAFATSPQQAGCRCGEPGRSPNTPATSPPRQRRSRTG